MEWSDKHDLVLCREVLAMEPYQHPYRSKERGNVWNQIAINLNGLDHPKFKVNKRSIRDRLTLLITKHKAKIRQEENASGIACEETELDQALEEIIDKEKLADEKSSEAKKKEKEEKEEKAAAEEHRQSAMERLGQTKRRNADSETDGAQAKKSRRSSSDVVEYLREKYQRESDQRKEEMELRKMEQQASVELQQQQNDMMRLFMQQQQQQTQILLSLLSQKK